PLSGPAGRGLRVRPCWAWAVARSAVRRSCGPLLPGKATWLAPRGAVLVLAFLVLPGALAAAEVPAGRRLASLPAAHRVAADLLAAPPAPEVPGRVCRDRRRVADDAQRPLLLGGLDGGARNEV